MLRYKPGDIVVIRDDLEVGREYSSQGGIGRVKYTQQKRDFAVAHDFIAEIEEVYSGAYAMKGLSRLRSRTWAFYDSMIAGLYSEVACREISEDALSTLLSLT